MAMLEFIGRLARQQRRSLVAPPVAAENVATVAARELLADGDIRGDLESGLPVAGHPAVISEALRLIDAEQYDDA